MFLSSKSIYFYASHDGLVPFQTLVDHVSKSDCLQKILLFSRAQNGGNFIRETSLFTGCIATRKYINNYQIELQYVILVAIQDNVQIIPKGRKY